MKRNPAPGHVRRYEVVTITDGVPAVDREDLVRREAAARLQTPLRRPIRPDDVKLSDPTAPGEFHELAYTCWVEPDEARMAAWMAYLGRCAAIRHGDYANEWFVQLSQARDDDEWWRLVHEVMDDAYFRQPLIERFKYRQFASNDPTMLPAYGDFLQ